MTRASILRFVLLSLSAAVVPASALAGSSLPSTLPGVTIGNSHVVLRGQGTVLRGSAPNGKIAELRRLGVSEVVVFKNATGTEIDREVAELRAAGYPASKVHKIPFKWKDLASFKTTCGQVVDALKVIDRVYHTPRAMAFFHCTAGEDRTGLLAGLFKLLESPRSAPATVFKNEMCARGYEQGNPNKPGMVVGAVRRELTPLFLKMVNLISTGKLKPGALSKTVCNRDPGVGTLSPASFACPRSR